MKKGKINLGKNENSSDNVFDEYNFEEDGYIEDTYNKNTELEKLRRNHLSKIQENIELDLNRNKYVPNEEAENNNSTYVENNKIQDNKKKKTKVDDITPQPQPIPQPQPQPIPQPQPVPTPPKSKLPLYLVIVLLILIIALLMGIMFMLFKNRNLGENVNGGGIISSKIDEDIEGKDNIDDNLGAGSNSGSNDDLGTGENQGSNYDLGTGSNQDSDTNLDDREDENTVSNTTTNTRSYLNYNNRDDFETYYANGYSFGYPKNFYSSMSEIEDGYLLSADDGCFLKVTVSPCDIDSSDLTYEMENIYYNLKNQLYKSVDVLYKDSESSPYRRFILSAYEGPEKDYGNYIICNVHTDRIEFLHLKNKIGGYSKEELNHVNYLLDTVYRMCSFSGTSYLPRSYSQFQSDIMGSKK